MSGISKRTLKRKVESAFINSRLLLEGTNISTPKQTKCVVHPTKSCSSKSYMCVPKTQSLPNYEHDAISAFQNEFPNTFKLLYFEFESNLRNWVQEHQISHKATTNLLRLLKPHPCYSELPLDSRSLLKTPRKVPIRAMNPGQYCHFGLKNCLEKIMTNSPIPSELFLQIGCDGIPLAKSSTNQFWPILVYIENISQSEPFPVGIYYGSEKPKSSNILLQEFISDAAQILEFGTTIRFQKVVVKISCIIADAPARSFLLNSKSHTGYFGCGKCTEVGDYVDNRIAFLGTSAPSRTNTSFRTKLQKEHHRSDSELLKLPIDLVQQVPFEYMHLVCLGVMRKLLNMWINGKCSNFQLSSQTSFELSRRLVSMKPFITNEFARKPRGLNFLEHWKATEFRQFLLYTGPIVLDGILPESYYVHFLSLHSAISILCHSKLYKTNNSYAKELLLYFVRTYPMLYGKEQTSYNVHGLIHLADDSLRLGPLDSYSAFRFENCLGKIKTLIKSYAKPLQQVYCRILEGHRFSAKRINVESFPKFRLPHNGGVIENLNPKEIQAEYNAVDFSSCTVRTTSPDNIVMLKCNKIVKVLNIVNLTTETLIISELLHILDSPVYKIPCPSSKIGIFKVQKSGFQQTVRISELKCKCMILPITPQIYSCFQSVDINDSFSSD